jgi:hypothetical protein
LRAWEGRLEHLKGAEKHAVRVRWKRGPDSVRVRYGDIDTVHTDDYFLNINADDFGIEVDRVAKVYLPDQASMANLTVFDGEIRPPRKIKRGKDALLDQVVGLFEVEKTNRWFRMSDRAPLLPDLFFRRGERYTRGEMAEHLWKREVDKVMHEYMKETRRGPKKIGTKHLGLCPASAGILSRHLGHRFAVFLSFHHKDMDMAKSVYEFLAGRGLKVYFYPTANRERGDDRVTESVLAGLEQAETMLCLYTDSNHLKEKWPTWEREEFGKTIQQKPKRMFLFGPEVKNGDLPSDVRRDQMRVRCSPTPLEGELADLARRILARDR